ncbi:MAG: zinc-dependent metalloprotease [Polyangiaceae bacterium]
MRSGLAGTALLFIVGACALFSGCAGERDPVNRVQPNALPKSFFLGEDLVLPTDDPEFRMKAFTIDSSKDQSAFTIGEFTAVDRIRWEVTEDLLLARRSYQEVDGADSRIKAKTSRGFPSKPTGTIVGAFKILSHFDIVREYNAQTGEENNVISENTIDRPWHARSYMRIDWSKNLAAASDDSSRFFGLGRATPLEYAVTNEQDEDAVHVELENGYLDVTNKFTVQPAQIEFSWGQVPECQLTSVVTGTPSYDCNPQEAKVRLSFAKVAADEDFEPFEDNSAWREIVGNWGGSGDGAAPWLGPPRTKWDPAYGITDAQTKRFKAIHGIWKRSHQEKACTSNADDDKNGSADECENSKTGYGGRGGAQCDVNVGKCTIPVRDREIKTIAYFLNREAPAELQDAVDASGNVRARGTLEELVFAWNQLLEVSVAYRREVECRRTGGGDRDRCHAEFFESDGSPQGKVMVSYGAWLTDKVRKRPSDKGNPVLAVCHNPVRSYDPAPCGKAGDLARLGDIRKNFLVYWPYASRAHYGGVGANPPDPLTGETFGATATIMGRSASYAAAMQRDIVQVALGDMAMSELVPGTPAERYGEALRDGLGRAFPSPAFTREDIDAKVSSLNLTNLRSTVPFRSLQGTDPIARGVSFAKDRARSVLDTGTTLAGMVKYAAIASKLQDTHYEADLVDSHWLLGTHGANPETPISKSVLEESSPFRGLDPIRIESMRAWHQGQLEAKGACFHDSALAGAGSVYQPALAGYFGARYGHLDRAERGRLVYEDLFREAVKGIGLHELGHSLGLRHNFASSWDAPNYNPQYWQLRTNEGAGIAPCGGPRSGVSDTCMGPRYLDPTTPDEEGRAGESRPGIDYFANTSTMEYQLERFGETVGLGTYDQHAMKALYGRVLETFDDRSVPIDAQPKFAAKNHSQLNERDLVQNGRNLFSHYTSTARLMKVFDNIRDCRNATEEEKRIGAWRIVHGKVCAPPPKDHWSWDDFRSDPIPGLDLSAFRWHAIDRDGKDRVRWNYRYGEQYTAGGYMHAAMGDAGADPYELTQNLVRKFDQAYPWQYFRRGRGEWDSYMFLPYATTSAYFARLRAYHWQIATDLGRASDAELASDDAMRPYAMAGHDIWNFLVRAITMPEPGGYAPSAARTPVDAAFSVFDLAPRSELPVFGLGIVDGRYIGEAFDGDLGGSWDYQKYLHHTGYEAEKAMAMMQLMDSRPALFAVVRDSFLDGRAAQISFRSDLPQAVDRLLGGILSEDWETFAPFATVSTTCSVMGDCKTSRTAALGMMDITRNAIARPEGAMTVFPNIGYKQQLAMGIYAVLFAKMNNDIELANKVRLWLSNEPVPPLAGHTRASFTDPKSGYKYMANRFGDEPIGARLVDRGIASRMLVHANALLAQTYRVVRGADDRPVLDAEGSPTLILGPKGEPLLVSDSGDGKELTFRRYVELLDAMRQINRALGNGPLAAGED